MYIMFKSYAYTSSLKSHEFWYRDRWYRQRHDVLPWKHLGLQGGMHIVALSVRLWNLVTVLFCIKLEVGGRKPREKPSRFIKLPSKNTFLYILLSFLPEHKVMALATASATMESSSSLIQSESRVQRSYQEVSEQRTVKKKTKSRRHKDEGTISVVSSSY